MTPPPTTEEDATEPESLTVTEETAEETIMQTVKPTRTQDGTLPPLPRFFVKRGLLLMDGTGCSRFLAFTSDLHGSGPRPVHTWYIVGCWSIPLFFYVATQSTSLMVYTSKQNIETALR